MDGIPASPEVSPAPPPSGGEPRASSPLWLQFSGLPAWLNEHVNRSAWLVFKTVVELDCARNARPRPVEVTPAELAQYCGLPAEAVMTTLTGLRKKKCIALFLPDHPEEAALIEVKTPLPVPQTPAAVRERFPFNRLDAAVRLRYAGEEADPAPAPGRARASGDLQRVIDLYLNTVGLRMNTFILDELGLLCQRFSLEAVEKAFARAVKNDIRNLGWVVKELYRGGRTASRTGRNGPEKKRT